MLIQCGGQELDRPRYSLGLCDLDPETSPFCASLASSAEYGYKQHLARCHRAGTGMSSSYSYVLLFLRNNRSACEECHSSTHRRDRQATQRAMDVRR